MAKRRSAAPARKPVDMAAGEEHSLLLRSAESLGRIIGALQRQLDDATRRLSSNGNGKGNGESRGKQAPKKTASVKARKLKTVAPKPPSGKRKRASRQQPDT